MIIQLKLQEFIKKLNKKSRIYLLFLFFFEKSAKKYLQFKFIPDTIIMQFGNGAVAQLARAIGSYPIGREFESLRRYHLNLKLDRNI